MNSMTITHELTNKKEDYGELSEDNVMIIAKWLKANFKDDTPTEILLQLTEHFIFIVERKKHCLGSFLTAVLNNDLHEAGIRISKELRPYLYIYSQFLNEFFPRDKSLVK